MKPYVIGTQAGQDILAFEVEIGFTAAACKRLGEAVVLAELRVLSAYTLHTPPFPRQAVWLSVKVPANKVDAAKQLLGDAEWRQPVRASVGSAPPAPTWGELRDMVQALLKDHRGTHLPCGHPVALLVFDSVDGATYTCPLCKQQQVEEA